MEWELLYMCNIIGFMIIMLIFIYHFIGTEEESKPVEGKVTMKKKVEVRTQEVKA